MRLCELNDPACSFFIGHINRNHLVKQHPNGPNLTLDIDDFRAYFKLRSDQLSIRIRLEEVECALEMVGDFAHGGEVVDLEDSVVVDYAGGVELCEDDVLLVEL